MRIKKLNELFRVDEAHKPGMLDQKDWDRMMDLYNRRVDDNYMTKVADKINDADKALARAVAGLRILMATEQWSAKNGMLSPDELKTYLKFTDLYNITHAMWNVAVEGESEYKQDIRPYYIGLCTCFLKRAAELGKTEQQFYVMADEAVMPANLLNKETKTKDIVGGIRYEFNKIEKKYNVVIEYKYAKNGSKFWSYETSNSYNHNGRCWPIAYEYTIYDNSKTNVISTGTFVDVTNEGGGRYGWDYNGSRIYKGGFKEVVDRIVRDAGL